MDLYRKRMDKALKAHDSLLFLQETKPGRFDVYRKSQTGANPPHFIFPLTDTWKPDGKPVDWGIEVVLNRLKAHDMWNDKSFIATLPELHEKEAESKDRARRNDIESFLYDFRSQFHRATSDINTSLMDKKIRKEY